MSLEGRSRGRTQYDMNIGNRALTNLPGSNRGIFNSLLLVELLVQAFSWG